MLFCCGFQKLNRFRGREILTSEFCLDIEPRDSPRLYDSNAASFVSFYWELGELNSLQDNSEKFSCICAENQKQT